MRILPLLNRFSACAVLLAGALDSAPVGAGPPFMADDPEPTARQHFEIYLFGTGESRRGGRSSATGIDFNYGGAPDLQLTAVAPFVIDQDQGERARTGLGNVELAAKYRFAHQEERGWDAAVFPRVFLTSASGNVGERHTAVLVPIWLETDWSGMSTFGGGGWVYNRGAGAHDFWLAAWALTRRVSARLELGAELQHQTPDGPGSKASTGIGLGARYDASDHLHLLAYGAPGVQNAAETARYAWYVSVLFTD